MERQHVSAEEQAYRYIKAQIINKKLLPNQQIVEMDVAEESGLSRTSIRTAIRRLHYEGLALLRPNKGAVVVSPSLNEIQDIYACKRLLETEAIKLAATKISSAALKRMEELLALEPETFHNKDFNAFLNLNTEFHMLIAQASGNSCYVKYIKELLTKSNVLLIFYDDFMTTSLEESDAHREHIQIYEALCARDAERCANEMFAHSDTTYETLSIHKC
ncbi:MAG: GntR family transcriptional regulator [Candidatus Limiplasma sp.]|nr:GntR family transcriptional regulator [Candidatus Limiplasma sp.]